MKIRYQKCEISFTGVQDPQVDLYFLMNGESCMIGLWMTNMFKDLQNLNLYSYDRLTQDEEFNVYIHIQDEIRENRYQGEDVVRGLKPRIMQALVEFHVNEMQPRHRSWLAIDPQASKRLDLFFEEIQIENEILAEAI
jgi:hypothetical protein